MFVRLVHWSMLLVLLHITAAAAVEIDGQVAEVKGREVFITTDSQLLPVAGDPVEILVQIPGLEGHALVAHCRVSRVDGDQIVATIERATANVAQGQLARVTSEKPVRKRPVPARAPGDQPPLLVPVDEPEWAVTGPSAQGRQVARAVAQLLPRAHLSRHPVDDQIAQRMLDILLRQLDRRKEYFSRADVDRFQRRVDELDNELRDGKLQLLFDLFQTYVRRVNQRISTGLDLVEQDHDFSVDEPYVVGGDQLDYASSDQQSRDRWRKRVKYHLLTHLAAGQSLEDARRLTRKTLGNYRDQIFQWTADDVLDIALNALALAYDPHSSYISPKKYQDFVINQQRQLVGIGASLQTRDGYIEVVKLIDGGPAQRDGRLQPGDRILAVGSKRATEMQEVIGVPLRDAVRLIRGLKGTSVYLRVLPKGQFEAKVYELQRDTVRFVRMGSTVLAGDQLPAGRRAQVGYIRLPAIYAPFGEQDKEESEKAELHSASIDVGRALAEMEQHAVDIVILDLRNNGGGSLGEALRLGGLLLGDTTIVQAKGADNQVRAHGATGAKVAYRGPVVVLVNKITAGGAEIIAAAWQDYGRALIVGDRQTHGYGTVQNVMNIGSQLFKVSNPPQLGFLKVTQQRFYRPSGPSTQLAGVEPDVVLPSATSDLPMQAEETLQYALATDRIAPARIDRRDFGISPPRVATLQKLSDERRQADPFFRKLAEQNRRQAETAQVTSVNLNKEKFLAARRAADRQEKANWPAMPGVTDVQLDGYVNEVLQITLDYLSRRQFAQAEEAFAARRYGEGIRLYKAAVAADPQFANGHYKLAWALATTPSRQLRDGPLAVKHAERACQLSQTDRWYYLLALAVAQAEAGSFDDARTNLDKALEQAPADQRRAFEFLKQRFADGRPYQSR